MTEHSQNNKPQTDNSLADYEALKQRNRQRLIGAGAITLVLCGLLLVVSGGDDATETSAASQPAPTLAANNAEPTPAVAPTPAAASEPVVADVQAASSEQAMPRTDNAEPVNVVASAPVAKAEPPLTREQKRVQAERNAEQNRRKAQAVNAEIAAEQSAQQKAIVERARQAKLAAEQKRREERESRTEQATETVDNPKNKSANNTPSKSANTSAANQNPRDNQAKQPAPVASSKSGRVQVQVGAYSSRDVAQKVQAQLNGMGYSSQVEAVRTDKGTMYRVRANGFTDRSRATQAANQFKSRGLKGMIIEQK